MEVIPPGVTVAFHRRSPSSRSLIRRASGSPKVTEPLEHWGQKSPSAIYFPNALRRSLLLLLEPLSSQAHSLGYAMTATKSMKPKAESWRKSRNATGRRKETICCQVWLSGRPARKPVESPGCGNRGKATPQFSRGQPGNTAIPRPFLTDSFGSNHYSFLGIDCQC